MTNNNLDPLETASDEDLENKREVDTQQLTRLEDEVAKLKDQWLRAIAEMENMRLRARRDREEAVKYANTDFGRDMFSIADNLRRALESCSETENLSESVKALIQGIKLTESVLLSTLNRHGIKKIEPLNEKFDANLHQAMLEVEDESVATGTVVQVLQVGYVMHGRLLRPAMVSVSKVTVK